MDQLVAYHWPGNVRELQNMVEHAVILWTEGPLAFELPRSKTTPVSIVPNSKPIAETLIVRRNELKSQEREAIVAALKQCKGKVYGPGGAAQLLGVKPSTLSSRITALGLNRRAID